MNIVRTQVRNILLTLVVVCAFIIDARTARASTSPWPECMPAARSEEHTSELQSLMRISYAVFCLKKNKKTSHITCNVKLQAHHTSASLRHTNTASQNS